MKTAVQWLKEQYIDRGETLPSGVFQEALEMEKKAIRDAYNDGHTDAMEDKPGLTSGTMYYNEKYNREEQKQHIIDIMKADEEDGLYNELNK